MINKKFLTLIFFFTIVLMITSVASATDNSTDTSVSTNNSFTPHVAEQTSNDVQESSHVSQQSSQNMHESSQKVQQSSKEEVQKPIQPIEKTTSQNSTVKASNELRTSQNTVSSTNEIKNKTEITKNSTQETHELSTTSQKVEYNTNTTQKSKTSEVTESLDNNTIINNETGKVTNNITNTTKELTTASSVTVSNYKELYNEVENIKNISSGSTTYTINLKAGTTYYIESKMDWGYNSSQYVKTLIINGNGATISGLYNSVLFYVYQNYSIILRNVNINDSHGLNGGYLIDNFGTTTIENSSFYNNYGTMIYTVEEDSIVNIVNTTFEKSNYVSKTGNGIITVYKGNVNIVNCSFKESQLNCIYSNSRSNVNVYNTTFTDNVKTAIKHIYSNDLYNLTVINSTFTNNNDTDGGAIYGSGYYYIYNSTFRNNKATNYGGAINIQAGVGLIVNSTFINNTAKYYPVLFSGLETVFINNTIYYYGYNQSELIGPSNQISNINTTYHYSQYYTISTSISASNFSTKTNTKTQINATINGSDGTIPTGNVNITINGNTYTAKINSDGSIRYNFTFTNSGSYSIKIAYAGSNSYEASSKTITATVSKAIVGTYIITYDKSATVGQSTNLYGYIYGNDNSIPSGSVTITVNEKSYTSSIGSDGYVHISYTFGSAKNYTVKISYAGSSSYSSSSSSFTVTVKSATKINTYITTSDKNATVNKSTNLYGYIKANDGTIPKGSVTITVNGKDFTSSIGSDGYVHISYIFGSAKNYIVKISYAGSSTYSSSSSTFTVTVKSPSTINTSITTINKSATLYKDTNLYGYIKAKDNSIPSGSVTITVNGKSYTSSIGSDGYVHISYTFVNTGKYDVKINYAGSSTYSSSSSTFTVTVSGSTTRTVSSYSELYNTIQEIKTYSGSETYTINLVDGNYKITNTITWGSTKGIKNLVINGNGVKIYGSGQKQFLIVDEGYSITINSLGIMNCYGYNGGSINNAGNLTINNCIFNNSKASNYGGSINIKQKSSAIIKNSNFTNCYGDKGGAINLEDSNVSISNCNFEKNSANYGGSIYCKYSTNLSVYNSKFTNSNAIEGGAIHIDANSNITYCTFINNTATSKGGSIYGWFDFLENCVFNNSKAQEGGAVYTLKMNVSNTEFNNNQATKNGGAIYICDSGSIMIKTTTFKNNSADTGGAIYNNERDTNVTSSNFINNIATTGGAIYNRYYIKITNSTFTTNSAESGGALYNCNSKTQMIVENSKFNNNTALYGGAIFNYNNADLQVSKSTFSYNQASNAEAIRNKKGTATLTNNTITFTSAQQSNTIVTTDGITVTNSLIYNRVNKLNVTVNMAASMFVTGNSGTITGNITDSNNKLITDSLTVTFSINGKNITTQTIKNGKINVTLSLSSFSSGVYNITTTLKESSNYTSSNATTVLFKDKKHSIVTTSTSGKNGETVTLTAYISNRNGTRATSGTATFKLNGVTIKDSKGNPIKVSIKNGVASYTYTIPTGYSAKDYKLTAVADVDGRIENTAKLTILKTDQKLTASTSMFVTGNTAQLTGTIVDVNGKTTTRDTKVAIKINGKTIVNTKVTNGKLDVKLDLSKYNSGAYTIEIVLGENGCYNTGYANMTLIKNMKNSIVVMPTNNTAGSNGTLYAFVTDSNGNRQSSGTVTFKIDGTTVGTGKISNGVANITYNTLQYYTGSHTLTVSTTVNGKTITNSTTLRIQ